jgi:hypothetical protein
MIGNAHQSRQGELEELSRHFMHPILIAAQQQAIQAGGDGKIKVCQVAIGRDHDSPLKQVAAGFPIYCDAQ